MFIQKGRDSWRQRHCAASCNLTSSAYNACINDKKLSATAATRWAKTIAHGVFTNNYKTVPDAIRGYLG